MFCGLRCGTRLEVGHVKCRSGTPMGILSGTHMAARRDGKWAVSDVCRDDQTLLDTCLLLEHGMAVALRRGYVQSSPGPEHGCRYLPRRPSTCIFSFVVPKRQSDAGAQGLVGSRGASHEQMFSLEPHQVAPKRDPKMGARHKRMFVALSRTCGQTSITPPRKVGSAGARMERRVVAPKSALLAHGR